MTDIELVKQFSGKEAKFVYTFPQFLVYNVGGWDGLIKVDNKTKKCTVFKPFDYAKDLIKKYFKDPKPVENIVHSDDVDDVYCALFEDDDSIVHSDVYHALFGVDDAIIDHLAHHGILGMKWGIRRFQNPDGTRTAAGKARYNEGDGKSSNSVQKVGEAIQKGKNDKQRKAALEKARQAKAQKAEREAYKKKALESGDYKQIQKYSNELTTQELKSALDRADTLARLNQNVARNTPVEKTVWDKIDDAANKVQTITNAAEKGKNAWNTFAKAWNTFADDESMLPEIGTNFAEQQEKKRKEKAEKERKDKIEAISKTVDPEKIMKNQALFTDAELKSAKERVGNYEGLRQQKKLREEGADSVSKDSKNKESFSDSYDKLDDRERELEKQERETEKKNEAVSAAKKEADREKAHEKFNSDFDRAKELAQKELDEAVKRSQRSVYNESIDSPKFNNYTYYWDF